jgi:hypothetical protein
VKATTKIAAILLCVLLGAGGAMLARKEKAKTSQPKTRLSPVINQEEKRPIWIWA